MAYKLSDDEFIAAWNQCGGSPETVAKVVSMSSRAVYARRANLAKRGIVLKTIPLVPNHSGANANGGGYDWQVGAHPYTPRVDLQLIDGYAVIFSDSHFWPGVRSMAFEALLLVLKELKPKLVISNGDAVDGAGISRHDPLGWQKLPKIVEELDATKGFLGEIERASPNAEKLFIMGNHDSRFDRRLATEVAEFEDIPGMRLEHHIRWRMCYAALINESTEPSFVVHNIRGGMYAPKNNVMAAGCTVFTGHLHSQKIIPVRTLLNDWEGIDCGTLADRDGPQFSYLMARPTDWREGFAVQRYDANGYRYPAELCRIQHLKGESRAVFRGESIFERRTAPKKKSVKTIAQAYKA